MRFSQYNLGLVFHTICSSILHPCYLLLFPLLHFPPLHFPPLQFCPYRIFYSRIFSRPLPVVSTLVICLERLPRKNNITYPKSNFGIVDDAQLSQRDRAAGCDIVSPKVEDWNWETILYGHYRFIFNHCDIIGLKICRIP